MDTIVHINVKLKESAVMGKTVSAYDKYCRGSKDYFTLSREIITIDQKYDQPAEVQEAVLSERMEELVKKEVRDFVAQTQFSIAAPGAKSVYVTGTFNDWSLDENCRLSEDEGRWNINLDLKPGVYKYQFIVDGVWKEDPQNDRKERNSFGDINSIIEVSSEQPAAA